MSGERGTGCEIRIHPSPCRATTPHPASRRRWTTKTGAAGPTCLCSSGGGSLQDLWAFNDERVAGAVYRSRIPVVAGIGHEVDTSIADMVADLRAAMPSHAAQLLWPERQWYAQLVDDLEANLLEAAERRLSCRSAVGHAWQGSGVACRNAALPGLRSGSAPLPAGWILR
ncbi:MAG: exodeoxyribonuclease VII large subunit [Bilophila wadsworthia]